MSISSLQLAYRPDLDVLTARWFITDPMPDYRTEYAAVLAAGKAHATRRWLLDVRRRPVPVDGAAHWVATEWFPNAAAAVAPARLRVALLLSPQRTEAVRTEAALQPTVQGLLAAGNSYDVRLFNDEGEAVRWLTA